MAEVKPYRQDESARRKKIVSIVSLALLAAAASVLTVWYFHSKAGGWDAYSGKVVQISGSIHDIGLVKVFREGRSIVYYSAASGFKDLVFHRLQDCDSIRILAGDTAAFLRMKEKEKRNQAERAVDRSKEMGPDDSLPPPMKVVAGDEEPKEPPPLPRRNDVSVEKTPPPSGEPSREDRADNLGYAQQREEGLGEYDREVGELAAKADRIDSLWEKYASFCQGTIAVSVGNAYGRHWFGIYTTINAADTPECRMMVQDMQVLAAEIDAGMEAAWEKAHHSGVYPGQIRAVQQKYRMELDRWNK
jgi:hypothetical protein